MCFAKLKKFSPQKLQVNSISSKNTLGVKKARPSKVEPYLEVNT